MTLKPSSKLITLFLLTFTAACAVAPSAQAYEWRYGHWTHDRHEGRLGWWWVVGPAWYYYTQPRAVYVVQQPQPVIVQQAPPVVVTQPASPPVVVTTPMAPSVPLTPVLYYCSATGTQYPQTMTCPGGWSTMTAETPPRPLTQ